MADEIAGKVFERVQASGRIEDVDVMAMRRFVFDSGPVDPDAVRRLFDIERVRTAHNAAWSELFCEAVTDLAIYRTPPSGYLSEENAVWLIAQIGERKDARTDTELEALASIVEKAREVPRSFSAYVLRQIKSAVVHADGLDALGRPLTPGAVRAPELRLMQRVLWGAEAGGHLAISREEAEALFDIADATAGATNDAAWNDMFARAVGNYLIGATARPAISREAALQAWNQDYEADVVETLTRFLNGAAKLFQSGWASSVLREGALGDEVEKAIAADEAARAKARAEAERFVGEKADWLVDRVRRNGLVTGPEAALLAFVAREARELSPELRKLIDSQQGAPPSFGRRQGSPPRAA